MPKVSVIVPCYNEQATVGLLLNAIYGQTFPRNEIEVIIADGQSTDNTRVEIRKFQQQHPDMAVNIIENLKRAIPSGLNRAIEASVSEYLIRMDAHSIPAADYIEGCIKALQEGLGDNVGGIWQIKPGASSWIARGIAVAASHPLGVGDAFYRVGALAQAVDTVPFGAFRRELIDRIGTFDETLLTNEDYEFNVRVRQSGGKVWLDPAIQSTYYARATLGELARQYWRYGYWKAQMLRRYPKTLRWRQALPPLFVTSLIGLGILSIGLPFARWLLAFMLIVYTSVMLCVGIQVSVKHKDPELLVGTPMAIATMHFTWGAALVWGLIKSK
jgi:glycosyltransferase involved in cell wall biosynthesis